MIEKIKNQDVRKALQKLISIDRDFINDLHECCEHKGKIFYSYVPKYDAIMLCLSWWDDEFGFQFVPCFSKEEIEEDMPKWLNN